MAILMASMCMWSVTAHAIMSFPAARQVIGKAQDEAGFKGTRCGVSDSTKDEMYDTTPARDFKVVESFSAGQVVNVKVTYLVNHGLAHSFQYACMDDQMNKNAKDATGWETLMFEDGSKENKNWCGPGGSKTSREGGKEVCTLPVRLPEKNCKHGMLIWRWEDWANCADIAIGTSGGSGGSSGSGGSGGSGGGALKCEKSKLQIDTHPTTCQEKKSGVTLHFGLDAAKTTATVCIENPSSTNWLAFGSAKNMQKGFVSVSADGPADHDVTAVYKLNGFSLPQKEGGKRYDSAKDIKKGNMRTLCVKLKKMDLIDKENTDMSKAPFVFAIGRSASFDHQHGSREKITLDLASSMENSNSGKDTEAPSTTPSTGSNSGKDTEAPSTAPSTDSNSGKDTEVPSTAPSTDSNSGKDTEAPSTAPSTDSNRGKEKGGRSTAPSTDSNSDKDTEAPVAASSTDSNSDKDTEAPVAASSTEDDGYDTLIIVLAAGGFFIAVVLVAGMIFKNNSDVIRARAKARTKDLQLRSKSESQLKGHVENRRRE